MIAQIAALPRSGTAFLTVMLNLAPNCLAFHELMVTDEGWKSTLRGLALRSEGSQQVYGDVGTYQFAPGAMIEGSEKVYVRQDHEQSRERVKKAFGYDPGSFKHLSEIAEKWADTHDALVIEHDELFDRISLGRIWRRCNPWSEFPEEKVAVLLQMNIQRFKGEEIYAMDALKGREGELWGQ